VKLSLIGMSVGALVLASASGLAAFMANRSIDITCSRVSVVSDVTCQISEPLMRAIWIFPGVFAFAASIFLLMNFMSSEVTGFGSDDHFG
jgi:hypothetical protein